MTLVIAELGFIVLLLFILLFLYRAERISLKRLIPKALINECWDGKERRAHFRFDKALEVSYKIIKLSRGESRCKTSDISASGAKLLLNEKLPTDSVIHLDITLPNTKKTLRIQGKIVWSKEVPPENATDIRAFYSGVEFCRIKDPNRKDLMEYVQSLASEHDAT